jgi:hypothetical protein
MSDNASSLRESSDLLAIFLLVKNGGTISNYDGAFTLGCLSLAQARNQEGEKGES